MFLFTFSDSYLIQLCSANCDSRVELELVTITVQFFRHEIRQYFVTNNSQTGAISYFRDVCLHSKIIDDLLSQTPSGTVLKQHWRTLLDREGYMKCNLRIAYKLTPVHLDPKGYQTMNVRLAFEVRTDYCRKKK